MATVLSVSGSPSAESRTARLLDHVGARLTPAGDGSYRLDGIKQYSTGALFAHWIPVLARVEDDTLHVAYLPRDAPGLTVVDDWDGMGQRTTASGTVKLDGVAVPADRIVPHRLTFQAPNCTAPSRNCCTRPSTSGSRALPR